MGEHKYKLSGGLIDKWLEMAKTEGVAKVGGLPLTMWRLLILLITTYSPKVIQLRFVSGTTGSTTLLVLILTNVLYVK